MTFNVHADLISFCDNDLFWDDERDGDHYTENGVVDNNCGEVKERNDRIESLREKYTAPKKSRGISYEDIGQYTYKDEKARQQFLKEIEQQGLDLKLECKQTYEDRLDYLFVEDQKVGRDPVTKEDPDIHYSFRDLDRCQKEEEED
jgi:hypothetical protein